MKASGSLAFAMAIGNIFSSIALFTVRPYQVSDVGGEFSAGNYIAFRLATIVFGLVFASIYLMLSSSDSPYLVVSFCYLLFKMDESLVDVLFGIEQCGNRMDYIGKSQIIRGTLSLGTFCLSFAFFQNIVWSISLMALSCCAVTFLFDIKNAEKFDSISPHIDFVKAVNLGKKCLFAMLASLCATAIVSISRQYYGLYAGESNLGIYASIATPAVLVQAAASYVTMPFMGQACSFISKG